MPDATLQTLLDASPWTRALTPAQRASIVANTLVKRVPAGGYVCRKGERVEHWIGIVEGLVKMASVSPDGKPTMFTGIRNGGWFGEGSLLKDEPRRYDIVAIRDTTVAYVSRAAFMLLLDESVAFNRFLLVQLNERLAQFIAMVEHERLLGPDARLARGLAWLFNPVLYPDIGPTLPLSQEELAQLTGMSRQRANQALKRLEQAGLIAVEYGAIRVLALDGLRQYEDRDPAPPPSHDHAR
ncbi:MAG: Crp/Fnr family transcriptional regulator [Proteobacteria bacterium]|nr:Crp/Fnr family transcriptional regulator [Pseudomonadota bacterium]